jgi:D-alanyl-D-alanine carboxypeptidase
LVDTTYELPKTYYPPDLVSTSTAGLNSGSVRSIIIPELKDMATAAKEAGNPLAVQSAFRSYATQVSTFNYWVSASGYQAALLASARPGHSEHQLGTAIDFRGVNDSAPWNYSDWGRTKTGAWMAANAWKYGFIMSYPAGRSPSKTCYEYEPWHFRYVGREEAAAIHSLGLSTREWLWQQQPNQ